MMAVTLAVHVQTVLASTLVPQSKPLIVCNYFYFDLNTVFDYCRYINKVFLEQELVN